jgi:hypothetical protein
MELRKWTSLQSSFWLDALSYMIIREGADTDRYFEPEIFLYIGGSVAVIAGLKKMIKSKKDDSKVPDSDSSHS